MEAILGETVLAVDSLVATLAFLVVLRVLIKLFFWMDMVFARSCLKFWFPVDPVRESRRDAKVLVGEEKLGVSENKPLSTKVLLAGLSCRVKIQSMG